MGDDRDAGCGGPGIVKKWCEKLGNPEVIQKCNLVLFNNSRIVRH